MLSVLGIGFGPANLALAIAIAENNAHGQEHIQAHFVEPYPTFKWHPGMLHDFAEMQISFLKDLATLRNPSSPYTFLAYLKDCNRLCTFINRSTFIPSRLEFTDYLRWCAEKVASDPRSGVNVSYGTSAESVQPVHDSLGNISSVSVTLKRYNPATGVSSAEQVQAHNLVIAMGGKARIPASLQQFVHPSAGSAIHTSQYLQRIDPTLKSILPTTTKQRLSRPRHKLGMFANDILPPSPPSSTPSMTSAENSPSPASSSRITTPPSYDDSHSSHPLAEASYGLSQLQLNQIQDLASGSSKPIKIAVLGSGQSSAECFYDVRNRLKSLLSNIDIEHRPEIHLCIKGPNIKPSDDSEFANEVFEPIMTDFMYNLAQSSSSKSIPSNAEPGLGQLPDYSTAISGHGVQSRRKIVADHKNTNYSVVNPKTLRMIYEEMYAQKIEEDTVSRWSKTEIPHQETDRHTEAILCDPKLVIKPYHQFIAATSTSKTSSSLTLTFQHALSSQQIEETYDLVIMGTGYERDGWMSLLGFDSAEPEVDALGRSHNRAATSSDVGLNKILKQAKFAFDPYLHQDDKPTLTKDKITVGISRNYRLMMPDQIEQEGKSIEFTPRIWIQGSNEASHGISDSLLSVLAVRSGEITQDILNKGVRA